MEGLNRMTYMPEGKIQELEKLDSAHMGSLIMKEGVQKTAELFVTLLRSYRLAAHVANAAWKVSQEAQTSGITPASWQELQKALHLYSPGNFPPFQDNLEFCCVELEKLYNYLSQWNTPEASTMVIMEKLFDRINDLRMLLTTRAL